MWNSLYANYTRVMSVAGLLWFSYWCLKLGNFRHHLPVIDITHLYKCGFSIASEYEEVPQAWVSAATWESLYLTSFGDFSPNNSNNLAHRLPVSKKWWNGLFDVYWNTFWQRSQFYLLGFIRKAVVFYNYSYNFFSLLQAKRGRLTRHQQARLSATRLYLLDLKESWR